VTIKGSIDFIIPAHNEAATVAAVSSACVRACEEITGLCTVTVVADHCTDGTEEQAKASRAMVVSRTDGQPSKSQAVQDGVRSTTGDIVALFDADCLGLSSDHILGLIRPVAERRVDLSVGVIDYGRILTPIVQRYPWSSGQRVVRRDGFDWDDARLCGYSLEMVMNESIGLAQGVTYSTVLEGVRHISKYRKLRGSGSFIGNFHMWKSIAESMKDISAEGISAYFDGVRLRDAYEETKRPVMPSEIGTAAMWLGCQVLRSEAVANTTRSLLASSLSRAPVALNEVSHRHRVHQ